MTLNVDASPEQTGLEVDWRCGSSPEREGRPYQNLWGMPIGWLNTNIRYIYPSENLRLYAWAQSLSLAPERGDSDVTIARRHPVMLNPRKSRSRWAKMDKDKGKVEVGPASGGLPST